MLCRPLKADSGFFVDAIDGLRSLRSLTRGYYLPPLRGWLAFTTILSL